MTPAAQIAAAIEIQRRLGMRPARASMRMPRGLAAIMAKGMTAGLNGTRTNGESLDEADAGCVLLIGHKR